MNFYLILPVTLLQWELLIFKTGSFEFIENHQGEIRNSDSEIYFDLASLSKPLTNSLVNINEKFLSGFFFKRIRAPY